METFVRTLRETGILYETAWVFNFTVMRRRDGSVLSLKIQRTLLEPFHKLQGQRHTCIVAGSITKELQRRTFA